jgi:hypothetical protein
MIRESGFDFRQGYTYSSLCCPHHFQGQSKILFMYNGYWELRTWIHSWAQCRFLEEEADIRGGKTLQLRMLPKEKCYCPWSCTFCGTKNCQDQYYTEQQKGWYFPVSAQTRGYLNYPLWRSRIWLSKTITNSPLSGGSQVSIPFCALLQLQLWISWICIYLDKQHSFRYLCAHK